MRDPLAGARDLLSMLRALSRGSRVDAPTSVPRLFWEFLRTFPRFAPSDSPLSMREASAHEGYRDLATPKLRVGDPAFDFELPRLDAGDGVLRETGQMVRLSSFSGSRPVALVFGSYT